ncbi:hypothetical protein [Rivibacter subsaxonicus]|uniref:Uncharacterized protein n=1 Tax=Rivibacter subsaxonicus TaxID=457575 RepID=A0A4Q7VNJ7_9BURK|nr:hypothetical protein [Rivibacter subsaxonicus]RZT97757.1 hypothetical protein EV670_2151 [Rivibacter subsaxonicus]
MKPLEVPAAALLELSLLRDHLLCCAQARSPLHRLRCVAESIDDFMAPRFVTTLALTMVVLAVTTLAG